MISVYEDLISVRENIHKIQDINMKNKFMEAIHENTGRYVEYQYPIVENLNTLVDKDIAFIENLETVLVDNNEKFLKNYQEAAEKTNPIGLVADKVAAKSINNGSLEFLNAEIINAIRSNNIDQVDDLIEKIAGNSCDCFDKPVTKLLSCDGTECLESVVYEKKKLDRSDVEEAIETIKKTPEKLAQIKDKAKEKAQATKSKLSNLKNDMDKSAKETSKKPEKEYSRKVASECCAVSAFIEMEDMINHSQIIAMESQLIEELKSARSIVAMTAFHNPRNIRESAEFTNGVKEVTDYNFDFVIESAMDFDYQEYMEEKANLDAFDNLKVKMVKNNNKFLDQYSADALKSNCEGIVFKKWYIPVDLKKKFDDAAAALDKEFNKATSVKDLGQLKENLREFNGSYIIMQNLFGKAHAQAHKFSDGKLMFIVKDVAFKVETNHKVNKTDVKNAVAYLKKCKEELDKAAKDFSIAITKWYFNPNRIPILKVLNALQPSKKDSYIARMRTVKESAYKYLLSNYKQTLTTQIQMLQAQCRKVVMLAARNKTSESDIEDIKELNTIIEQLTDLM